MEEKANTWGYVSDAEMLGIRLNDEHCVPPLIKTQKEKHLESSDDRFKRRAIGYWPDTSPTVNIRSLNRRHPTEEGLTPQNRFRRWHLSVTLLCEQSWCEMKMVLGLLKPLVKQNEMKNPEVKAGTTIHLKRQLEVHDIVPIQAHTREDREAIKLLNVMSMMSLLEEGQCVREFPVLGVLEGMFFLGVIDELSYSTEGELVLSELKTRKENSLPGKAQAKGHDLQVGLYKLLFDGMVNGTVKRSDIIRHLKLQPKRVLGTAVLNHAGSMGIEEATFGGLADLVLKRLSSSKVGTIQHLKLEYIHQDSGTTIDRRYVRCEEDVLRGELRDYLAFWRGQREPRGVDIEEAWKCRLCPFQQSCQWGKDSAAAGAAEACVNVDPDSK
ncbi:hypothetical protein ACEWY4_008280 [Coilia grayii]|uniref:Exonuclease V n=1 Tax=Coilia grayii TaxID=363190 RepID=A0ABD1KAF7_9TELE